MYDFDVQDVCKRLDRVAMGSIVQDSNSHGTSATVPLVRFRYRETADAAAKAPAPIRMFLENVGFDFEHSPSRIPDGFYDEDMDAARLQLIDRITVALSNRALRKAIERKNDQTAFDHRAFMTYLVTAKPIKLDEDGNIFRVIPKRPQQTARRRRPRPV